MGVIFHEHHSQGGEGSKLFPFRVPFQKTESSLKVCPFILDTVMGWWWWWCVCVGGGGGGGGRGGE